MRLTPYIVAIAVIAAGCQKKPDSRSKASPPTNTELIELNRSLITQDRHTINDWVSKSDRSFTETSTGLWYSILGHGSGPTIKTGDNVNFDYECTLLNGNPCYNGNQTIRVGYTDAGSGVTEGLQMMREGSDYLFIVPPYLAFGLTGDGAKIPGRAILIYRIRVRDIN